MTEAERFHLFIRILDPEDYNFVRSRDPLMEGQFRRKRARIYRKELRSIAADSVKLYRVRAANIAASGRWAAYPPLVIDTISGFFSVGKLFAAGILFAWRLPVMIDTARNADRVLRFVTSPTAAAAPSDLPA